MSLEEATIYLDNPYSTYYAGHTMNGRIEYVFKGPIKIKGILVEFKGEVYIQDRRTSIRRIKNTVREKIFDTSHYVLGDSSGSEKEISGGKHVYDFTCTLPQGLPCSFEGEYGHIRYMVIVNLKRPWSFNHATKKDFTVINRVDLNLDDSYKEPIHMQLEKTFCCFCCVSLPLSVDLRAPHSGYCPGQVIPFNIDVDNKSNVDVEQLKIYLRRVTTFKSLVINETSEDIIHTIHEGPAPADSTQHWNLNMEIPPIMPTDPVKSKFIDWDYELKVECEVSGFHLDLSDQINITIGTVPLAGTQPVLPATIPTENTTENRKPAMLPIGAWANQPPSKDICSFV